MSTTLSANEERVGVTERVQLHQVIADRPLGLGRAVVIDDLDRRGQRTEPLDVADGQHFADEEGVAEVRQSDFRGTPSSCAAGDSGPRESRRGGFPGCGGGVGKQAPQGRREVADGDPLAGHPGGQPAGSLEVAGLRDHHGAAELERREDVAVERIVGEPGEQTEAVTGVEAEGVALPRHEVGQGAVAPEDALGLAGGAGGEGDVGGIVRAHPGRLPR